MVRESRALRGASNPQSSFCEATAANRYATPPHSTQSPRRREGQNRKNSLMKQYQTLPNVACLTNGFIMYLRSDQSRGCLPQPNRHSDAVLTLAGDCASDPSVEEREREGGRRGKEKGRRRVGISSELHRATTQKQHYGTNWPIPENTAIQFHPEFCTSCCLPRNQNPFCTSAAAQHSQQHVKQSYLWRTSHQPGSRTDSRNKDYVCALPAALETIYWNH